MLSDATLAYGESLTPVLLGVDALCRKPGGEQDDGLVVVNMSTTHRATPFSTNAEARAALEDLRRSAATLPEPDRRLYYDQLCESTLALLEWREHGLAFGDQIRRFLHIPAEPASEGELDALRSQMRAMLTGLGYAGDLRAQCAAWEARHRVPAADVQETAQALLDEAWDRTEAVLSIPAPKSDGMRVQAVSGVAFNARCDYMHRTVELNTDPVLTRPALKHLAAHECYPGHYVQFKLRETWHRQGRAAADGLLSIVNSASSSVFEGIADYGLCLVGWLEDEDDRFAAAMTRYRSGIGTGAAWRLHFAGWPADRVADWLREQNLAGGEGWVQNRMQFIAAVQRSALIWSYWAGEPAVTAAWQHVEPARRNEFLQFIYGRMHSTQSVGMFA